MKSAPSPADRVEAAVGAAFALLVAASSGAAQERSFVQLRLTPGEQTGLPGMTAPSEDAEGVAWRSLDTLVATVDRLGVVSAGEWGLTAIISQRASGTGDTVLVRVAPTGLYDFSGVFSGAVRYGDTPITRSYTGSLAFTPIEGGIVVESDCGTDDVLLDGATTFVIRCGDVSIRFWLAPGGEIRGEGGMPDVVPDRLREVCTLYDARGICVSAERQGGGLSSVYLRGPVTVHKRPQGP